MNDMRGGEDDPEPGGDAEESLFSWEVDYVGPWREADAAARELSAAAGALGMGEDVRAVAHTGPEGEPWVRMRPMAARKVAAVLATLARVAQQSEGGDGDMRDDWRTASGERVRIRQDRRGDYIECTGCPRPIKITGLGTAAAAARQHAQECRK
ncbi:hypothetical protein [Streptomyces sp. NPDC056682]|uniref:hypothetical protein n=1 Tax=Streptomyces sp. NPDC056682 TaxID=3345909 RepID=UPI0036CBB0A1